MSFRKFYFREKNMQKVDCEIPFIVPRTYMQLYTLQKVKAKQLSNFNQYETQKLFYFKI